VDSAIFTFRITGLCIQPILLSQSGDKGFFSIRIVVNDEKSRRRMNVMKKLLATITKSDDEAEFLSLKFPHSQCDDLAKYACEK
jgi:hypothetical protein